MRSPIIHQSARRQTPVAEIFVFAALPVQTARLFNPRPSFLRYDSFSATLSLNEQSSAVILISYLRRESTFICFLFSNLPP